MKTFNYKGCRIEPHGVIGENLKTGQFVIATETGISPREICLFFLAIAKLNKKTPEEMAQLLVRGAKHLLETDPSLKDEPQLII